MELRPNLFADMRQSMAITPRVIQSIKLLKFGHQDLCEYLKDQQERNPMVEIVLPEPATVPAVGKTSETAPHKDAPRHVSLGSGGVRRATDAELPGIEETVAQSITLREHLLHQVDILIDGQVDKLVATEIVEAIEPDGYLRTTTEEIASLLGIPHVRVETVLAQVQGFEPTGVGARDLEECLFLQLAERGEASIPMTRLLENLLLLAKHDLPALARICGISQQEVAALANRIRKLDPRPGSAYGAEAVQPAMPDVVVNRASDGTFSVAINSALLPKVLVNREYYAEVRAGVSDEEDTRFVSDCIKDANWLARNLDQRCNTLLRVATEIVKQQQDFFDRGVEHIKPLCQGDVADALGMHRSTVCRAIADKYLMTPRGLFELKYFFSNALGATGDATQSSAESIRARIRQMIEGESRSNVLSDDAIMETLKEEGVAIARRTVAKYREILGLPSSSMRRRQYKAARIAAELTLA